MHLEKFNFTYDHISLLYSPSSSNFSESIQYKLDKLNLWKYSGTISNLYLSQVIILIGDEIYSTLPFLFKIALFWTTESLYIVSSTKELYSGSCNPMAKVKFFFC